MPTADTCPEPGCTRPIRTAGLCHTHYEHRRRAAKRATEASRPGPAPAWRLPAALDALLGPRLPARPACTGSAPMFDEWVPGERPGDREARHARATAVCATCPARQPCADAAADLGAAASGGIWAGVLIETTRRPPSEKPPLRRNS